MTVIARRSPQGVELAEPQQRHRRVDENLLIVGHPATPERQPWSTLANEGATLAQAALQSDDVRLTGGWALVGSRGSALVIRTDAFGSRPLFYRHDGETVEVAEGIWDLVGADAALDPAGIADLLLLGHGFGTRTAFDSVSCTTFDATTTFDGGAPSIVQRGFVAPEASDMTLEEATQHVGDALDRLYDPYADVRRLLVWLSGGLDSRTLAAAAVDRGMDVTTATGVVGRAGTSEDRFAAAAARALGTDHHLCVMTYEGMRDRAGPFVRATSGQISLEHMHAWGIHERVPGQGRLGVNGVAGDVIFGGSFAPPGGDDEAIVDRLLARLTGASAVAITRYLPGVPDWRESITTTVGGWYAANGSRPRLAELAMTRNRATRMNTWTLVGARDHLDHVTPFFDEATFRAGFAIPRQFQLGSVAYRQAITERWPKIARVPWQKTGYRVDDRHRQLHRVAAGARRVGRRAGLLAPSWHNDPRAAAAVLAPMIESAANRLTPVLGGLGIDLPGLLAAYPAHQPFGRSLRFRVLTVDLATAARG